MSSSTGHTLAPTRALTSELFPCLNSPTTTTWVLGSVSVRRAVRNRVARSGRPYASQARSPRSTTVMALATVGVAAAGGDTLNLLGQAVAERTARAATGALGYQARRCRGRSCSVDGSDPVAVRTGPVLDLRFGLALEVRPLVQAAVALLGGHLRVVRVHAGLFVALLVAGGGVAADRQRGAVLHQVVGHVADITATDRDRAVVELRVPEVGDVPVPEVEGAAVGVAVHVHGLVAVSDHRVRHVSVGLHPGELPGVDRRLDVTPGEHRSVTGVDLTVVVTVDHHATAGGGVRDVVAGGD